MKSAIGASAGHGTRSPYPRLAKLFGRIDTLSPVTLAVALYLAALCVSIAVGAAIGHYRPDLTMLDQDELEYYTIASQLVDGTLQMTPRRTLGFPLLLAAIRATGANLIPLQVAITAVYATSVPLLFLLVRRLGRGQGAAVLAALALMLWPATLFYGTSLYSETAALPVFLLALCCLPAGSRTARPAVRWAMATVLAGIVLGLAAHLRPMYLLYLPFLLLTLLFEERRWRIAAARFALAMAGFLLAVLPWSAYMTAHFGRPILLTSNGGETLSGGLTPKLLEPGGRYSFRLPGRTAWVGPGKWLSISQNGYVTLRESQLPYDELDGLLQKRALAWAFANPDKAAWLELCKIAYMWGFLDLGANGMAQTAFGNVPILGLLFLSLFLLAQRGEDRAALARLWLLAGFVSMVAMISWGSWRFRQPGDAGLLAYCAVSLFDILRARVRNARIPSGAPSPASST